MKTIRNVVIFGIIFSILSFIFNFVINFILEKLITVNLYEYNIVLCVLLVIIVDCIVCIPSIILAKKIFSFKFKIEYESAKKMLIVILVIILLLNIIELCYLYKNSNAIERELDKLLETTQKLKEPTYYETLSETMKKSVDALYKTYTDGREELIELQHKTNNVNIIQFISKTLSLVVCFYLFGVYLYKKDNNIN